MLLMTGLSELKKKQYNIALMYFSVLGLILIVEVVSLIG
jgi:predicted nucleic acid-binding Zn ribbon protein